MALVNPANKGDDKERRVDRILEQYKMYVESSEKVSDRRSKLNTFYLSLTTTLTGIIGFVITNKVENGKYLIILLSASSVVICLHWIILLLNYKKLNSAKFDLIQEMEKELPINLYVREWEVLKTGPNAKGYQALSKLEIWIPVIFGALFLGAIFFGPSFI